MHKSEKKLGFRLSSVRFSVRVRNSLYLPMH